MKEYSGRLKARSKEYYGSAEVAEKFQKYTLGCLRVNKTCIAFILSKKEDASGGSGCSSGREMRAKGWDCEVYAAPKSFMGRIGLLLKLSKPQILVIHRKLFNPLEVRALKASQEEDSI